MINRLFWGCSSIGRAVALQATGSGFESRLLHMAQHKGAKKGKRCHFHKDDRRSFAVVKYKGQDISICMECSKRFSKKSK